MPASYKRILVIKLGALGDFIQALGPMAAIRKHHPDAHITLLTTKPYEHFAKHSGLFNDIKIDARPKFYNVPQWIKLRSMLNENTFERVYDLQNNDRTAFYLKLFSKKPEWVGAAPGASHRNTSPERTAGHAFDGHVQTLALAGVKDVEIDTLEWMNGDLTTLPVKTPYVLLVPGSAPNREEKRWPADKYGRLAKVIASMGFQPVILGTDSESEIADTIKTICPLALDLTGRTNFPLLQFCHVPFLE
ncbi:MAG: glycosyltransferase family 9 protein [Pseudomonadota bacterium]